MAEDSLQFSSAVCVNFGNGNVIEHLCKPIEHYGYAVFVILRQL